MIKITILLGLVLGAIIATDIAYMQEEPERVQEIDYLEKRNMAEGEVIFMRIVTDDGRYLRTSFTAANAETTLAAVDQHLASRGARPLSVLERSRIQVVRAR